jgi:Terminase large subunit, T4likevirus-type, N-terminal
MSKIDFPLHPKQWTAFTSKATEILYGGAAGAAKSHLMRVAAIMWALAIPGLQIYIFRRTYDDLIKNHMEGPTGFHSLLAIWLGKYIEIVEKEIRFNNGSKIYLCHCQHEKNRFDYQGAEIHVLLIDELTHFTEVIYRFLRSRVRAPIELVIPEEYKGMFPRILCGSNPGGIGHQFVKTTFIDARPDFEIWQTPDDEGGFLRQFIPANLADNPSLDQARYAANLSGLGNEALVKAMLKGDWDIVAGAALDINRNLHMIRPFKPPAHWTKFMGMDYGYVHPFSIGWYCVVEGGTLLEGKHGHTDVYLPDKAVIRYREWYGWNGKPNEGLRMESPQIATEILRIETEANERMDYRVADTQLWAKNDGPSMADRMKDATKGVFLPRQALKDRQAGYAEICNRLRGEKQEDGTHMPMFYVTENCTHFCRTVPPLILDELHPEKGPGEGQENHVYDELSYSLTSWPYVTTQVQRIERQFYGNRRKAKLDSTDPYRLRAKK